MNRPASFNTATKVGLSIAATGLALSGTSCSPSEVAPKSEPHSQPAAPNKITPELGRQACHKLYSLLDELTWRGPAPIQIGSETGTIVNTEYERRDLKQVLADESGTIPGTDANLTILAAIDVARVLDQNINRIMHDERGNGVDPASINFLNESGNKLAPMLEQAVFIAAEAYEDYCNYLPNYAPFPHATPSLPPPSH